ncbi:methyltransferase family protein [Stackebrandtia albiflava]|uniref:Methyltransferase family protein n=1 Tax=Stackebrandtia albiflava TaxID=406432 RepID=A0A562URH0_9ACTN|nr:class I SAM-dependent methyltransferase [Stackebrandtia albiflava]TWJ08209.1 methyltransferase family protein [Stackebrandtia albiflava]
MIDGLFHGTAQWYARYRPGIADAVTDAIRAAVPGHGGRLLDLGCGTGQVAAALPEFTDVVGIDPDADMLTAARHALAAAPDRRRVRLLHGPAETVPLPEGWTPDLVTACRSFHWMNGPAVLHRLTKLPGRFTMALMGDGTVWTAAEPWAVAVRGLIQRFLGERRRAGGGHFDVAERPFTEELAAAGFTEVAASYLPVSRSWTPERVRGYLYSTSYSAPALYGDRLPEFERELAATLADHSTDGVLTEAVTWELILARHEAP